MRPSARPSACVCMGACLLRGKFGACPCACVPTHGNALAQVGIAVASGGRYFSKRERGWLEVDRPFLLSVENPFDASVDTGYSSYASVWLITCRLQLAACGLQLVASSL